MAEITRFQVAQLIAAKGSLAGMDLSGIVLDDFDFRGINMSGANLNNASLRRCRFDDQSRVRNAILYGADLNDAAFEVPGGACVPARSFFVLYKARFDQTTRWDDAAAERDRQGAEAAKKNRELCAAGTKRDHEANVKAHADMRKRTNPLYGQLGGVIDDDKRSIDRITVDDPGM